MTTLDLFKKAIVYMLEKDEFSKAIEYATSRAERKLLIKDKEMFEYLEKHTRDGIMGFPAIPLVNSINSVTTYKEIVAIMALLEGKENGRE